MPKYVFLDNYFSNLFTEMQIWYSRSAKFALGFFFQRDKVYKFQQKYHFFKKLQLLKTWKGNESFQTRIVIIYQYSLMVEQMVELFSKSKAAKIIKRKWTFSDKHDHNISILFDGWANFSFITSETMYDF